MAELFLLPFVQALDSDGNPIAGATLTFYASGTSTLATIFANAALSTPLANPITADSAGRFAPIYLDDTAAYRAVLKNAAGVIISDVDPVGVGIGRAVSVKDFGAKGDGVTNDTAAFQAAFDYVANAQIPQITGQKITVANVFIPDGNYILTAAVKVRGFVGIIGNGTPYTGGSVVRQTTNGANIFEFYGSLFDNASLGTVVEGVNFEFAVSDSDNIAAALYYPRVNDIGGGVLNSNSHYIRRNRFGGWHRRGQFLKMERCNDVEISGNVLDVVERGSAIELGLSAIADGQCSDVRIFGNNFYLAAVTALAMRNVSRVAISGNNFILSVDGDGSQSILMAASGADPVVSGRIGNVTITGNTFSDVYNAIVMDASARGVVITGNSFDDMRSHVLRTRGTTDIEALTFQSANITLASDYNDVAVMRSAACKIKSSTVSGITIDAGGDTDVVGLMQDQSGTESGFGANMTVRDIRIIDNGRAPSGQYQFVPCSAVGLELETAQTFASVYPTNAAVYNLDPFVTGDSVSFDIDYEVTVSRPGVNIGTRTGRIGITMLCQSSIAAITSTVTVGPTVGADFNAAGGTSIPAVTFSVSSAGIVQVTVTCAITAPFTCTVNTKASNFRASGVVNVKGA